MYIIREVLNCRPGKVRMMIENFQTISKALEEMGRPPLRLLTDVSGEPFWTLVVEASVNTVEEFVEMERAVTEQPAVQAKLGGYHDLIQSGRREIYRIEPPPR